MQKTLPSQKELCASPSFMVGTKDSQRDANEDTTTKDANASRCNISSFRNGRSRIALADMKTHRCPPPLWLSASAWWMTTLWSLGYYNSVGANDERLRHSKAPRASRARLLNQDLRFTPCNAHPSHATRQPKKRMPPATYRDKRCKPR